MADSTLGAGEGKANPATVGQISQAYYGNEFADLNSRQQKKMVATTYWHNHPEAARAHNQAQTAVIDTFLAEMTGLADGKRCIGEGDVFSCIMGVLSLPMKAVKLPKAIDAAVGAAGTGRTAAKMCSFGAETAVLMADGTTKSISEVEVGDKVTATDPETGEQVARKVTKVWVHKDTVVDLKLEGGTTITTTEDHRFYNATDEQFQRADALDPGDKVLTDDGRTLTVIGLQLDTKRRALAYNLTIQGIHTYHVGYANILVHNECILSAFDTFGQARNRALDLLGKIDPSTRTQHIGRLGPGKGKVVGFSTRVNGVWKRFRIDYDPVKDPHINVQIGRGPSAQKWAIPWNGSMAGVTSILRGNG